MSDLPSVRRLIFANRSCRLSAENVFVFGCNQSVIVLEIVLSTLKSA